MNNKFNDYKDSIDFNEICAPSDTKSLELKDIDNFYLKLNKAARYEKKDKKFKFFNKDNLRKNNNNYLIRINYGDLNFKNICKRQEENIKAMGIQSKRFILKPDWRIIVGLGGESVYETSITLHHIYGFPYIPGQAIKGVCRNYVINNFYDNEECALKCKDFRDVFGGEEKKELKGTEGCVNFYDALPVSPPKIVPDIMNPHYSEYYSSNGEKVPADYCEPNIIPFLTVENTDFQFILGLKLGKSINILNRAKKWAINALTESGIGAKTSQGYGYMNEKKDKDENKAVSDEAIQALLNKFDKKK